MSARPPVFFVLAFGAGLATGLARFSAPSGVAVLVLGVLIAWALATGPRPLAGLLGVAAGLGAAEGTVARFRDAGSCAARLPAATVRLRVRLLEPADRTGGRIAVALPGAGCLGPLTARWARGHPAEAGAEVVVTARWVPRPSWTGRAGGTLAVVQVGALRSDPGLADRLRTAIVNGSRTLYGPRAPVVDALILGRRGEMDQALQDSFARSGLVHLLSISGFHVGLLAGWIFMLGRACRLSRARALVIAAAVGTGYVAFLGWPAPATRAAALTVLLALCFVRQRRVRPDPLLACTCLGVLLLDPWAVFDLGGWLSAAALWGATTCSRWTDRVLGTRFWWRCLGSSVGATLATAPFTAAALGSVALLGIVLNFVAIPVAAVAVPGVFVSLLVLPVWRGLAEALAAGAGAALHLLELLAVGGAAVPGGHVVAEAGFRAALPWIGALLALLWGLGSRTTLAEALRRWAWVLVAVLWIPLALALGPSGGPRGGGLALHFLRVGQGDGAVLRTPSGRFVVIDAGPKTERLDAGRRYVVPFLARQRAREIAALVVSHAHADHVGGAVAVLDRFRTAVVLEPGMPFADPAYYRFLDEVAADGIVWRPGRAGDRFTLDGVRFTVLHPDSAWSGWGDDLNEDSLVLLVEYGAFRALFPGDVGFAAEAHLRGRVGRVDVLKVGHHGSRGSTGDAWLDELRPQVAVVSVGATRYGHPAAATLERLRARRVALFRTDQDGDVTITTDGTVMTVHARDGRRTYWLGGPRIQWPHNAPAGRTTHPLSAHRSPSPQSLPPSP